MQIGEFSRITGIGAYTLRYYEKKGLIRVEKRPGREERFREADVEWVNLSEAEDTGMPSSEYSSIIQICVRR